MFQRYLCHYKLSSKLQFNLTDSNLLAVLFARIRMLHKNKICFEPGGAPSRRLGFLWVCMSEVTFFNPERNRRDRCDHEKSA
jgi:hypothetical protein